MGKFKMGPFGTDWAHLGLFGPGGLTPPFVTPLLAASGILSDARFELC